MDFIEKVKGFLMEPSKTFDASKEDTLGDAIKYYAMIVAIYSLLFALLFTFAFSLFGSMMGMTELGMMAGAGAGIAGAISMFVTLLISMIIGAFIGGIILHIFVYIVGGRNGLIQTIKALMYGSTPGLLLGWIPLINILAWIWSIVLEIIGIRQLHEITTGRAILAVLLPVIIIVVLFVAGIAVFIASMGGGGF